MAADKDRGGPGSASAEISKYLDILAKDPNSRVFAPLAEAYRKAGLLDDAVETALEGLKVHPNYLGGRVALGRAYFEKRQYAEAAAEMQRVAKAAPDNIIAHKVLGQIAYAQSDLATAEKAFKMVLLLDPRDQEAQQFVANIGGGAPAQQVPVRPPPPPPPPVPVPPPVADFFPEPEPITLPAPAREPQPVDEIQPLDEFDLQSDDLFAELSPAAPSPRPAAPPAPPIEQTVDDFALESPLDLAEPEAWPPADEGSAPAAEAVQTPATAAPPASSAPAPAPPVPDDGMELEVFSRVPWGGDQSRTAPPPAPVAAPVEETPFEVFGRPMRGGPPASSKGEQVAFGEIEIESTAYAPEPDNAALAASPFEIFTREPGVRAAPGPARASSGGGGARELDIETTAYTPSEVFVPDAAEEPLLNLEEELPRIDLAHEMESGQHEDEEVPTALPPEPAQAVEWDTAPTVAHEAAPSYGVPALPERELEPAPAFDLDLEQAMDLDLDLDQAAGPELGLEQAAPDDFALEQAAVPDFGLDDAAYPDLDRVSEPEAPSWGAHAEPAATIEEADAQETGLWEEPGPAQMPQPEAPAAPPAAARGVFDTETLAAIYVSQGFHGRAIEIYQRLLAERPADERLRRKLEETLALERGDAPLAAALPAPPPNETAETASAVRAAPPDQRIRQLQTLLDAFRGGRPQ